MTVNGDVGVRGIVACAKEIGLSSEFDQMSAPLLDRGLLASAASLPPFDCPS